MAFNARVIEVMIASPSDVTEERDEARRVLLRWNARQARQLGIVLLPLDWENHARPGLRGRGQGMITEDVLVHADILVGIFYMRLGTPTGGYPSGTYEEIVEHHSRQKPVMLYFSSRPLDQDKLDDKQWAGVLKTKKWAQEKGLTWSYSTPEDFAAKFDHHISMEVQKWLKENPFEQPQAPAGNSNELSRMAEHYLRIASRTRTKLLNLRETRDSVQILCDRTRLFSGGRNAEAAQHKAALGELTERGLADLSEGARDETHFTINKKGVAWVLKHPQSTYGGELEQKEQLPSRALKYLQGAAKDPHGQLILSTPVSGKVDVGTARATLDSSIEPRSIAEMREALDQLHGDGFIEAVSETQGVVVYRITAAGFRRLDG